MHFPGGRCGGFLSCKIKEKEEEKLLDAATEQRRPEIHFLQTWNFNECLSYSEIFIGIKANSAIMSQSKVEAN